MSTSVTVVPAAHAWEGRLDCALAAGWVLVLYSNLPVYVGAFVLPFLQPIHWIAALFAASAFRLLSVRTFARPLSPLFVGAVCAYAAMCLAWYVGFGGGDPVVLRQRLLGLFVALAVYAIVSASPGALEAARRAIAVVLLASVAINAYDITHPFTIVPASSEYATIGRAAGLFINPNQSGAALVLGLALSIGVLPPRWRVPYAIVVAAGVALTLSRGAMLGYAMVCALLAWTGGLTRGELLRLAAWGGACAWLGWYVLSVGLETQLNIDPAFVLDRVLWILDPGSRADFSQAERVELAERGWQQFLQEPLAGNGIGSTEFWQLRTSTHNLYVMLASDFGVAGLLVLPMIVLAATRGRLSAPAGGGPAGAFILFWGLLSHNVLTEYYLLAGLAVIAAAGTGAVPAAPGRVAR